MEKNPISDAPMSRKTMVAHLGLRLKNERKTKFRQLRVKEKENFYFLLTLNCLACQIRHVWLKFGF